MLDNLWGKFKDGCMTAPECHSENKLSPKDLIKAMEKLDELNVSYSMVGTKESLENVEVIKFIEEVNRNFMYIHLEPMEIDSNLLPDNNKLYLIKNENKYNGIKIKFE